MSDIVIIGGSGGIGSALASTYARRGDHVVITGRDGERTKSVADQVAAEAAAGSVRGVVADLADPATLADALSSIEHVDRLVLAAVDRDRNSVRDYDIGRAIALATTKLVGYTEAVHVLAPRMSADASILLFGGVAKDHPYPGSTTVTSVNAAVVGMVATLAAELAPIRVNSLHPGLVGDSPYWQTQPAMLEAGVQRTMTRRLVTTEDVVNAALFLLDSPAVNAVDLTLDGGYR
jgi:NAD(P)-dependent dehydrogenase (short-subunit alcohol dehydrogenase family)